MRPVAYYNEIDPKAAAWLRVLIECGLIAPGDVDERSIEDVLPSELAGYTQRHFFAGIGGWSLALRRAGWPDDRPVITGSCPCQPFSAAGEGKGFADERHLWPSLFWLIGQSRLDPFFGEQVTSDDGIAWLDVVHDDLEAIGYAVGAIDLPACSVGAPHKRQRFFFVADTLRTASERNARGILGAEKAISRENGALDGDQLDRFGDGRSVGKLADTDGRNTSEEREQRGGEYGQFAPDCGPANGFWGNAEWVYCKDDSYRAVEPGSFPLAYGIPVRMGRLRGYGNAINVEVAKEFIAAYMGSRCE